MECPLGEECKTAEYDPRVPPQPRTLDFGDAWVIRVEVSVLCRMLPSWLLEPAELDTLQAVINELSPELRKVVVCTLCRALMTSTLEYAAQPSEGMIREMARRTAASLGRVLPSNAQPPSHLPDRL